MTETSSTLMNSKLPKKRIAWRYIATALSVVVCLILAYAFVVPWYKMDMTRYGITWTHDRYSIEDFTRDGITQSYPSDASTWIGLVGALMQLLTVFLVLSLLSSVVSGVLSFSFSVKWGVIAGVVAFGILILTCAIFFYGILNALNLDHFSGTTRWSKSALLVTAPLIGFWMIVAATAVQGTQLMVLARSWKR